MFPLVLASLCGCGTSKPLLSPALVQQGVSAAVSYGVAKYPATVPYIRAAEPVICSASEGTNLAPAEVIAAVNEAGVLKTPESVFILNSALLLYEGVYNSLGVDVLNDYELLRNYLHATCLGIGQGLPSPNLAMPMGAVYRARSWPQAKWP